MSEDTRIPSLLCFLHKPALFPLQGNTQKHQHVDRAQIRQAAASRNEVQQNLGDKGGQVKPHVFVEQVSLMCPSANFRRLLDCLEASPSNRTLGCGRPWREHSNIALCAFCLDASTLSGRCWFIATRHANLQTVQTTSCPVRKSLPTIVTLLHIVTKLARGHEILF